MKIGILYSELMPYNIEIFSELRHRYNCTLFLVHWDNNKRSPFIFSNNLFEIVFKRSEINFNKLYDNLTVFNPDLLLVSGRMDDLYLKMAKKFKARNIPIVMGSDDCWEDNLKNNFKRLFSRFLYHKYFTHCWVPGLPQVVFCSKLGFDLSKILCGIYSCSMIFSSKNINSFSNKRFLFVGRLIKQKNVVKLIESFSAINKNEKKGWKLRIVGVGDMNSFKKYTSDDIELFPYQSQTSLIDHALDSSVFVLPSIHEPWGVVVHEFASIGLPLLLSNKVGAASQFLIHNYNGILFNPYDFDSIKESLLEFIKMDSSELKKMSERSSELAAQISPVKSAAVLMSIFKTKLY
jgi:glycosyltransferase involved in cell wall biosynthesis